MFLPAGDQLKNLPNSSQARGWDKTLPWTARPNCMEKCSNVSHWCASLLDVTCRRIAYSGSLYQMVHLFHNKLSWCRVQLSLFSLQLNLVRQVQKSLPEVSALPHFSCLQWHISSDFFLWERSRKSPESVKIFCMYWWTDFFIFIHYFPTLWPYFFLHCCINLVSFDVAQFSTHFLPFSVAFFCNFACTFGKNFMPFSRGPV